MQNNTWENVSCGADRQYRANLGRDQTIDDRRYGGDEVRNNNARASKSCKLPR